MRPRQIQDHMHAVRGGKVIIELRKCDSCDKDMGRGDPFFAVELNVKVYSGAVVHKKRLGSLYQDICIACLDNLEAALDRVCNFRRKND